MFCPKCGSPMDEGATACRNCGVNQVQNPPVAIHDAIKPRRKKHVGLWVFLVIVLLLVGGAAYAYGSIAWLPPKNLGVSYTEEDYRSVMEKLDIHIVSEVDSGSEQVLPMSGYTYSFSQFEQRNIEVTPAEAMAFFNEFAPSFWWFKNTQIKVQSDGTIITSSKLDVSRILGDLYGDVKDKIPIPLPGKANLYTEGKFAIINNHIQMTPDVFNVGMISVPKDYRTGSNLEAFSSYLDRIHETIPEMSINKGYLNENGNFVFNGTIPTQIKVTSK